MDILLTVMVVCFIMALYINTVEISRKRYYGEGCAENIVAVIICTLVFAVSIAVIMFFMVPK